MTHPPKEDNLILDKNVFACKIKEGIYISCKGKWMSVTPGYKGLWKTIITGELVFYIFGSYNDAEYDLCLVVHVDQKIFLNISFTDSNPTKCGSELMRLIICLYRNLVKSFNCIQGLSSILKRSQILSESSSVRIHSPTGASVFLITLLWILHHI